MKSRSSKIFLRSHKIRFKTISSIYVCLRILTSNSELCLTCRLHVTEYFLEDRLKVLHLKKWAGKKMKKYPWGSLIEKQSFSSGDVTPERRRYVIFLCVS